MLSTTLILGILTTSVIACKNDSQIVQTTAITELPVATLEQGATCACAQLSISFGEKLLYSNTTNYTVENSGFWDVRSADLKPKCVFLPANADEVAAGVSILAKCGAQFAVRGGGHMNFPGSNNINGGVMLALGSLTHLKVAADNSSIEVGPGNRLVDVYEALSPFGLYTIGGRLKNIGVPGLTLIGGFHYFNNKYGMTMDNIASYSVVLGNGTQVIANQTSNPDLFWALKGGANNFGIVTQFTFKAYPIPLVSTTIQNFNESNVQAFIEATCQLAMNDSPDIAAGSVITINYNATTKVVAASLLGVQEGTEEPPSRFANFSAIPSTFTRNAVMKPIEWHSALDTPFQMFRVQFGHNTMLPDSAQLFKMFQGWKDAVDTISDIEGLYPTFVMNFLPASAISVGKNNGVGNTWGLDDSKSWILWQFSTGWAKAEDDLRVTNWARGLLDYFHLENQALGLSSEFLYMGDAGEYQNPFDGFPVANVERMRDVRDQYDPLGVFTRLNWGGFKLGP